MKIEYDHWNELIERYEKRTWESPRDHPVNRCSFQDTMLVDHDEEGEICVVVGANVSLGQKVPINSQSIDPPDGDYVEDIGIWDPRTGEEPELSDKTRQALIEKIEAAALEYAHDVAEAERDDL